MLDYKEFTNKIKKPKHPEENEMHNSMYIKVSNCQVIDNLHICQYKKCTIHITNKNTSH